ncbi:hypothetical protein UA08_08587 [Talaromyces atroroseus]|uniref:Saccharopine dehydrogenase NADP binding domain-containing protein n=1 Tax=Talaromyces atroroseus TaxID=1441469 RepID=A0A225A7Y8_TALAT|nr:hypothetical protein UA08_08587 [Talaromyces atroroseus]OKL55960.1 hypothetical protein UA08_08587 [Talaromyces atroroseus]
MAPLIIYGATGYTGKMASEHAKSLGLDFIIAGRTEQKLKSLASLLDVGYSVFDVDQGGLIDSVLKDASVLLNCAGPFMRTTRAFIDACIRNKVHYLDIAAEIQSYQQAQKFEEHAKNANVMLLPGCGGSVAMLGCLASHVVEQVKNPLEIDIALHVAGPMSRGSAISAAENMTSECLQLVNGTLVAQDASNTAEFDFDDGRGHVTCFPITLPDLLTIQRSANVSNIRTYIHASGDSFPTGNFDSLPEGPTVAQREAAPYHAAVTVISEDGVARRAALHTINGYTFTSVASVHAAKRVLDDEAKPGFQTPAGLFGKDFIHTISETEIKGL